MQDPNHSLYEAQPNEIEVSELQLPSYQAVRDIWGNELNNHTRDKSNPTRLSSERPLDTIRSFQYVLDCEWMGRMAATQLYDSSSSMSRLSPQRASVSDMSNCSSPYRRPIQLGSSDEGSSVSLENTKVKSKWRRRLW